MEDQAKQETKVKEGEGRYLFDVFFEVEDGSGLVFRNIG
jgi:hypothetical protein